jgi:hypothetical protein
MKRIVFALTAATVLLAALSSLSWGQAVDKPRRVGVLLNSTASDPGIKRLWQALLDGLHENGWDDGRNGVRPDGCLFPMVEISR